MSNFNILVTDEADRQFILLSLALCALLRPGFNYAAGEIAEKLSGRQMFEDFKKYNNDIVKKAEAAPKLLEACKRALPYLADHIGMTLDQGPVRADRQ